MTARTGRHRAEPSHTSLGKSRAALLAVMTALALAVGACEEITFVRVGVGTGVAGHTLVPGTYSYDAWSDFDRRWAAWWGFVDLRADASGRLTGTYRLPRQCTDRRGVLVDCVGRVTGRSFRDGTLHFRFDDGWLIHEGIIDRHSRASGRWESRIASRRDLGTFELIPTR